MSQLQLVLLGPPKIGRVGEEEIQFRSRSELALLAYLAVEARHNHSRIALLGLLWPDQSEENARNNLRVTLSRLRKRLDAPDTFTPYLLVSRQFVQFNPASDYYLDIADFSASAAAVESHKHTDLYTCHTCRAWLQRTVDLYRGNFLDGLFIERSPAFDEWLLLRREQLHLKMLKTLETLTAVETALGHHDAAICYARRQIELDPLRETGYRQLMRVLAGSGQRSEALRVYERCRYALVEEFGVAPAEETTALVEEIRAGVLSPHRHVNEGYTRKMTSRQTLPVYLTSFCGRSSEISAAVAHLGSKSCRLLTLTGPPGVGKTRLAAAVAHQQRHLFPDGVSFVDLGQIDDPALLVTTIAQVVGVKDMGERPLFDVLRSVLRHRSMLLVLDNFEHILPAAPIVAKLLKACPNLKLLVTSREALHVSGEQIFPLSPLPVPALDQTHPLDALHANDAVQLFVERAQSVQPDFALTQANATFIIQICGRLDGLPLALELAATRIDLFSPAALLRQLRTDSPAPALRLLSEGGHDRPARHQTLGTAIAWSCSLLSAEEQRIFRQIAIFSGDFSLDALEVVCGATDHPPHAQASNESMHVWRRLASLIKKSLVQRAEIAEGEPRYRMLVTIREHAREQLQANVEEALAVGCRYVAYFVSLAEAAAPYLKTGDRNTWLRRLDRNLDDLRAAYRWAIDHGNVEACLRLASALSLYFFFRSNLREGRALLEEALQAARHSDVAGAVRLKAQRELAEVCCVQGDSARAQAVITECVQHWRATNDGHLLANALINLSQALWLQGQAAEARAAAAEGLERFRSHGDPWGMVVTLLELAQIALAEQAYDEARSRYEESLALTRTRGDKWAMGLALLGLAQIAKLTGKVDIARALFDETLRAFEAAGHTWMIAYTLNRVAHLACHERQYSRAKSLFHHSLRLWQEIGQTQGMVEALGGLACVAAGQGDLERAVRLDGAVCTVLESIGQVLSPFDFNGYQARLDVARAQLGDVDAQIAETAGRALVIEDAIRYALGKPPSLPFDGVPQETPYVTAPILSK